MHVTKQNKEFIYSIRVLNSLIFLDTYCCFSLKKLILSRYDELVTRFTNLRVVYDSMLSSDLINKETHDTIMKFLIRKKEDIYTKLCCRGYFGRIA